MEFTVSRYSQLAKFNKSQILEYQAVVVLVILVEYILKILLVEVVVLRHFHLLQYGLLMMEIHHLI